MSITTSDMTDGSPQFAAGISGANEPFGRVDGSEADRDHGCSSASHFGVPANARLGTEQPVNGPLDPDSVRSRIWTHRLGSCCGRRALITISAWRSDRCGTGPDVTKRPDFTHKRWGVRLSAQ